MGCKFITCDKDIKKQSDDKNEKMSISKFLYFLNFNLWFFPLESSFDNSNSNSDQKSEAMRQEAIQKAKKIKEQMEKEEELKKDPIEKEKQQKSE